MYLSVSIGLRLRATRRKIVSNWKVVNLHADVNYDSSVFFPGVTSRPGSPFFFGAKTSDDTNLYMGCTSPCPHLFFLTTTMRTRRSSLQKVAPQSAPSCTSNADTFAKVSAKWSTLGPGTKVLSHALLMCVFLWMEEGVWRRILQLNEDQFDDICNATGQEWALILPLLINLGLLEVNKRSTINGYNT